MKQKILIALIAIMVSIATLNALCKQNNTNDVCLNQIGAGVAIAGAHFESDPTVWVGRVIAGAGGSAVGTGLLSLAGVVVVSNPVGWVVGGIVVGP